MCDVLCLVPLRSCFGCKNTSRLGYGTISIEYVDDEKTKKQLIGLKAQDKLTLDPNKVSKGEGDMAAMLGIKQEQAKVLKSQFQFTVQKINRVTHAALNTQ